MKKALLFDLDGTLLDSLEAHKRAIADIVRTRLGKNAAMPSRMQWTNDEIVIAFNRLAPKQKWNAKKFIRLQNAFLKKHRNRIRPIAARIRYLRTLRKHYQLGLVTNSYASTVALETPRPLLHLFDVCITHSDTEKGKPHPDMLLLAAKRLNARREDCIFIGDAASDLQAARRARMDAIGWFHSHGAATQKELEAEKPLCVVQTVRQLEKALQKANSLQLSHLTNKKKRFINRVEPKSRSTEVME